LGALTRLRSPVAQEAAQLLDPKRFQAVSILMSRMPPVAVILTAIEARRHAYAALSR
jgi:hypothetical protein